MAMSIFYNTGDNSGMPFSEMHVAWPCCTLQRVSAAKTWVSAHFSNLFTEQQQDAMFLSQIYQGDLFDDIPWQIKTTASSLSCKVLF